jgi:hypothetical protein
MELPFVKVRKNAKVRLKTSHILRNLSVISQRKNNLQKWKDSVSYGQRWIVETAFSCIKRMFGEYVYSVRLENMIQEMMLKASLYNKMILFRQDWHRIKDYRNHATKYNKAQIKNK